MGWTELNTKMMKAAIEMASLGVGKTYPNPAVGAIIARGDRIVARGYHRRAGLPHAEIEAIEAAGSRARGGALYVTLEPCNHCGKTPPCTEAIIRSGIKRVFVASRDPNPLVNGRGIRRLRRAGLTVRVGLMAKEAKALNEAYFVYMQQRRPFVTLKVAQTLDGMIATRSGDSKWITSARARAIARKLRGEAQAVLVGINTVIADDPLLVAFPRRRSHYMRCILDTHLRIPLKSRIVRTAKIYPTIVYYADASRGRIESLRRAGIEVRRVRLRGDGRVRVKDVVDDLASREVMHLFVEGGALTLSSFLKARIFDRIICFVAPRIIGGNGMSAFGGLSVKGLAESFSLCFKRMEPIGTDVLLELR